MIQSSVVLNASTCYTYRTDFKLDLNYVNNSRVVFLKKPVFKNAFLQVRFTLCPLIDVSYRT